MSQKGRVQPRREWWRSELFSPEAVALSVKHPLTPPSVRASAAILRVETRRGAVARRSHNIRGRAQTQPRHRASDRRREDAQRMNTRSERHARDLQHAANGRRRPKEGRSAHRRPGSLAREQFPRADARRRGAPSPIVEARRLRSNHAQRLVAHRAPGTLGPQRVTFPRRSVPERRRAAGVTGIQVRLPLARLWHSHRARRTLAEPEAPHWRGEQDVRR